MYKVKPKKPKRFNYDLVVIGTGAGGGVAAHLARKEGKKVAIIEDDKVGGECPNYGCVPTKAMLHAADAYDAAREAEELGINARPSFDYSAVQAWKDAAVRHTGTSEGAEVYARDNIELIRGHAHFLDPWTIAVANKRLTAKHFLIATGAKTAVPAIPGLSEAGYLTSREVIALEKPPSSLLIIGGGAIGCEFARLFSVFGSQIHIVDIAPGLLSMEDPEVGELTQAIFENDGIEIHLNAKVHHVTTAKGKKVVHFKQPGTRKSITVDEILVASGKASNTDLGLENAGVAYNPKGIKVNRFMQTTAKHIYAAGDCVGPYRFTHMASYQSRVAAHNMFHNAKKFETDYHAVPRCVFIWPEVASVGATEMQLKEANISYQKSAVSIDLIGRATTSGEDTGFVKVLADKSGVILGACIVSPRAGEMIHELALAVQHRLKARHITETIHAYPTWSEAVRLACLKIKNK